MKQAVKIVIYVLIVLAVAGAIGFIIHFTNGGTTELKTFYLEIDGEKVINDRKIYLRADKPLKIEPKYLFEDYVYSDDYTYRIIPHITDETNFDYTVDGQYYGFAYLEEVTAAFHIEGDETGFTVYNDFGNDNVMRTVMDKLYEGKIVDFADVDDMDETVYFDLVVTNYNDSASIVLGLKFPVNVTGLTLDDDAIVFNKG